MYQITENINKCKKILQEYSESKSIAEYLQTYEKLSLYSVFLAENLSTLKTDYNRAYYKRKIEVSHSFLNNRAEKISEKTALTKAEVDNESLVKEELESEALAMRLELFLKQINKALEAMRTRISFEKTEKERIRPEDI